MSAAHKVAVVAAPSSKEISTMANEARQHLLALAELSSTLVNKSTLDGILEMAEADLKHMNNLIAAKHRYKLSKGKIPATEGRVWMTPARVDANLAELAGSMRRTVFLLRNMCHGMEIENQLVR